MRTYRHWEFSHIACGNAKYSSIWKFHINNSTTRNATCRYWLKRNENYDCTKAYTWMFIVIWYQNFSKRKQLKCTLSNKWVNTLWHIHVKEYYSTRKGSKVHATAWIDLKSILLTKKKARLERLCAI